MSARSPTVASGVTAPQGFRASGVSAGIKAAGGPDRHRASGRSKAEDGGARLFCFAMQSARRPVDYVSSQSWARGGK